VPTIQLTDKQKQCKHNRALKVRVSDEYYTKFGVRRPKVEVVCADCEVCVSRGGTVYFNRPEVVRGVILEHWPTLIGEPRRFARTH